MGKEKEIKKTSKLQAVQLLNVLSVVKSSSLEKADKIKLILLRSKLRPIAQERDEIIENVKSSVSKEDVSAIAGETILKWGKEEIDVNTRVLSEDSLLALLESNDLVGIDEDVLWENLKK